MNTRTYDVMFEKGRVPVKSWTRGVLFEETAKAQLNNIASLPFIHKWVAAMPDVHAGKGATVGSVIPTKNAIIPAAVGMDLGCGMIAARTGLMAADLPDNLGAVRTAMEAAVPHGRSHDGGPNDRGAWQDIPADVADAWRQLADRFKAVCERHPRLERCNHVNHLGTLGTGNHFIEVCLDQDQRVWLMLHSGSRGVGGRIGNHFITLAKREMERWFIQLPDKDLAYLPEGSQYFDDYVEALSWAQDYARLNREVMMARVVKAVRQALGREFPARLEAVNCHHNYVEKENHYGANIWVTRKGAVRAREGDLGIIPGSMGARSYIVRGLGHPESFCSCSHGAGRVMTRAEAKRSISLEAHAVATRGVECRRDAEVIDESPAAYKPIDAVMAAQSDLVEIVHTLKQVVCVKG